MSQFFLHPLLLWGLPVVGVPVLIHLINMLRHRRVDWAAMEFLLVSQRRNRTWIIFKQLLLLLVRMAAIALLVLVVAGPLLRNRLGNLLGDSKTHHIILLDDSFSMSDRWGDTSAFTEAKTVVGQIGAEAARQVQPQTFTLLRFSRVAQADHGTRPDMLKETVKKDFVDKLRKALSEIKVSQTSAGPGEAIGAIGQLLGGSDNERRFVYLISDFRAREWDHSTELRKQLLELNVSQAELNLINCVDKSRSNLAITSLAPSAGNRAAGVPLDLEVTVENFGTAAARNVSVLLEEGDRTRPAVTFDEIPPGERVTKRFPIFSPAAGEYLVTARLGPDAVAADNARYRVVDFPVDVPVLLIADPADPAPARFLSWALSPGGSVRTGIRPQIESPKYLRGDHPLGEFHSVVLVDLELIEDAAVETLEQYVAAGGGLTIFLGEESPVQLINAELYRDGAGLFPAPLVATKNLLADRLEKAPDLQVTPHPVFRVFAGSRNSYLTTVIVARYFAVADDWRPEPDSTTRVIARLRNGAPLVVEKRFGKGRVMAFLTTAGPAWNNWARNPSFVVMMQDLQAYLARWSDADVDRRVGSRLELAFDPENYRKQVRFDRSEHDGKLSAPIDAAATSEGLLAVSFSGTDRGGVYQARLTRSDGTEELARLFAVNVDAEEGDLKALSGPSLATRLKGVEYRYDRAGSFRYSATELAKGSSISRELLYLLILLLIGEQIFAYSAGYHPPVRRAALVAGGVR